MVVFSHEKAMEKAEKEFNLYRNREMKAFESDFDKFISEMKNNLGEHND